MGLVETVPGLLQGLQERARGLANLISERYRAVVSSLGAQADAGVIAALEAESSRLVDALTDAAAAAEMPRARYKAYRVARRNRFLGRWLAHGEGYPDWSLRLFHRAHAGWSNDEVHEAVLTTAEVGRLEGDLLHDSAEDIATYMAKQNRYTTLQAGAMFARGGRCSTSRMVASPLFRFIRFYFLRAGFLDGVPGLAHIAIGCFNSFCKYAKLRQLELQRAGRAQ